MSGMDIMHVNRRIRLSTPSGESLPTETVWFRRGEPPTMRVLLPWHGWERVADAGLFGLDVDDPPDLRPDSEVVVEAELRPGVDFPDDRSELKMRLADPDEPLRSTGSWVATDVRQAHPVPDEEELTDSVFDENDEPRAHAAEIGIRQVSLPRRRARERERGSDRTARSGGGPGGTSGGAGGATGEAIDVETMTADERGRPDVDDALEPVVDGLDAEGWPYEVREEGRVVLRATFEDHTWDVFVSAVDDALCLVTSVHPERAPLEAREESAADLLAYSATASRGGFAFDPERSELVFRTPFVPSVEPVADALTENLTAMAEFV